MQAHPPTATADPPSFYRIAPDGAVEFNLHAGQDEALHSPERFVAVIAGAQSGKTVCGPLWLRDEIERRGAGDYLAVAPSYPLMQKKMLPEFLRLFESVLRIGRYKHADRIFEFSDGSVKVYFGHADDPESLESATAKAAWLDEPGQKRFRLGSWEAILRRLAIHRGRALLTTTPYDLGWLKTQVYDRWKRGDKDYWVVNFDSKMNPAFPEEEYERARRDLPGWKFRMFYQGQFERPAGLIYDCFDSAAHVVPAFTIPADWPRFLGLDFGGVNTAGVFFAKDPKSPPDCPKYYLYREYHHGGRTAKQHAAALLEGEPGVPVCAGGSKSEDQWRDEFKAAGLPIKEPPVADVEVGINRVYGFIQRGQFCVFDSCTGWLDEAQSYSREVDDNGEPTEKIEDKECYHRLDATRYISAYLAQPQRIPHVW